MKHFFAALMAAALALPALAQDDTGPTAPAADAHEPETEAEPDLPMIQPGTDRTLDEFLWIKRPIVVFADSPADPRYVEQINLLSDRIEALRLRDVIVLTDTDPSARSDLRRELRPRGFALVVIGKDGTIITRKPLPWDVREISRAIDKMPLRQQEIRDRRDALVQ